MEFGIFFLFCPTFLVCSLKRNKCIFFSLGPKMSAIFKANTNYTVWFNWTFKDKLCNRLSTWNFIGLVSLISPTQVWYVSCTICSSLYSFYVLQIFWIEILCKTLIGRSVTIKRQHCLHWLLLEMLRKVNICVLRMCWDNWTGIKIKSMVVITDHNAPTPPPSLVLYEIRDLPYL